MDQSQSTRPLRRAQSPVVRAQATEKTAIPRARVVRGRANEKVEQDEVIKTRINEQLPKPELPLETTTTVQSAVTSEPSAVVSAEKTLTQQPKPIVVSARPSTSTVSRAGGRIRYEETEEERALYDEPVQTMRKPRAAPKKQPIDTQQNEIQKNFEQDNQYDLIRKKYAKKSPVEKEKLENYIKQHKEQVSKFPDYKLNIEQFIDTQREPVVIMTSYVKDKTEVIIQNLIDTKRPSLTEIFAKYGNIEQPNVPVNKKNRYQLNNKMAYINYREMLLKRYLNYNDIVKSIKNSFDFFMKNTLQMIITNKDIVVGNNRYFFNNVLITKPSKIDRSSVNRPVYPNECRINMNSYICDVYADLYQRTADNMARRVKEKVQICKLPVMLRSEYCNLKDLTDDQLAKVNECRFDPFGYFIVRGVEKTIFNTEGLRVNRVFMYPIKGKSKNKPLEQNVSITCPNQKGSTVVQLIHKEDDNIVVKTTDTINDKQKDINVFMIFLLFIEDIKNYLIENQYIMPGEKSEEMIITTFINIFTKDEYKEKVRKVYITSLAKALYSFYDIDEDGMSKFLKIISEAIKFPLGQDEDRLKQKIIQSILPFNILNRDNNTNVMQNIISKLSTLAIMLLRICENAAGVRKADNRDSWGSKRIEPVGKVFEKLFTKAFDYAIKSFTENNQDIGNIEISRIITDSFIDSFTSNNFGIKTDYYRTRSSEQLTRNNNSTIISYLTKVSPPANERSKVQEIRKIQLTQAGFICPVTTPDSGQCGITKELAITCKITNYIDPALLGEISFSKYPDNTNVLKLFINGIFYGWTTKAQAMLKKEQRRYDQIHEDICIYIDETEIWIDTLSSRLVRPLIVRENIDKLLTLNPNQVQIRELRKNGIIEYIDAWEQEKLYICESLEKYMSEPAEKQIEYTHIEIDPNALLSFTASTIPFPGHMQGPRSTYQAAMSKQAMSIYHSMYNQSRYDTSIKVLHGSEVPLVYTNVYDQLYKENPGGFNCVVAVMPYKGYNQEDALILNKQSVQLGKFRYSVVHTYRSVMEKDEKFAKPDALKGNADFDYMDENGLPKIKTYLKPGSCIIGKVQYKEENKNGVNTLVQVDASEYLDKYTYGYVESVVRTFNSNGSDIIKVRLREPRSYAEGDKMASRYAQKGTVGKLEDPANLPFTESGVRPDIIVNPHSIPSRMTMGMLMEIIAGKAAAFTGERVNATSFRPFDVSTFENTLQKYGFGSDGKELMYDGQTGEPLKANVFMGMCYYQALKHHPKDKIQVRSTGLVSSWTQQPVAGRGLLGGKNLLPQWMIKHLLVTVLCGETIKFRGSLKIHFMNVIF